MIPWSYPVGVGPHIPLCVGATHTIGWCDFRLFNIVTGLKNSKISLGNVAFSLGAWPQEILPVSLNQQKGIGYLTFLKVAPETKVVP